MLQYDNSSLFRCPENHNDATIFFYHGAGGTYRHFKLQISHLLGLGFRVVTFDMFGHGKSQCNINPETHMFSFEQYCYDALSLFDRFSENSNNVLIGHSYGTRYDFMDIEPIFRGDVMNGLFC